MLVAGEGMRGRVGSNALLPSCQSYFVTVKSRVHFFHRLLRLLAKQLMERAEILCVCMSLLSNGLPVKSKIVM